MQIGTRIGAYEVIAKLGEGGMGEVYRARDAKLNRDVALKVLPEAFSLDQDRLTRFRREAQVLASLNHPHIGAIYGFEDSGSTHALVLELVDGPTLDERIAQGPIPLEEALPMAKQIADALEAAHDQGVIHRDLKPANIKLMANGRVKVLDFGLAKMMESDRTGGSSLSMSPTIGVPATYAGVILGTATYMSPEQARGKLVDQRTDIWSFGCVLFEMLAGRKTFEGGDSVSDAVAAILTREPDWSVLPPGLPANVRTALRRCLQKDANRRLRHIADVRLELEEAAPTDAPPPAAAGSRWARAIPWALALAAAAAAGWALLRAPATSTVPNSVVRLELNLPPGMELFTSSTRSIAVSPEGTRVAYVGTIGGSRQVYIRRLDQYEPVPLRGTDGPTSCFFSYDGKSVGVITAAGVLSAISIADGLTTRVSADVNFLYGATWLPDDRIVFNRGATLWVIPKVGGTATQLTKLGGARDDRLHAWPVALPDGKTILFAAQSADGWRVEALTLATSERRIVVERATIPAFVNSGHLAFFRDDQLLVAPFDPARQVLTGPVTQMMNNVPIGGQTANAAMADISRSGTVVYSATSAVSRLVWVSRQGLEQPLNDVVRGYANPRLSPDGNRIVVQTGDLWIQDLARATFERVTAKDVTNGFEIWTPDGQQIIDRSAHGLRVQDANGSGKTELIPGTTEWDYPGSVTPDGKTLVFLRSSQETSFDILKVSLDPPGKIEPIVRTPAYEGGVKLSPDGRWLVYVSNESGQNEIYLRAFSGQDRRWQLSQGGTQPLWNPNGREVFYRTGNRMMAVDVTTSPEVKLGTPRLLFEGRFAFGAGITIANYDVTRDGQRFVMVRDEAGAARLNVVLNWFENLPKP